MRGMTGQTSSQIGSEKIATIRSEYSHVCFRNFLVSNFYLSGPFRFFFFTALKKIIIQTSYQITSTYKLVISSTV